MNNDLISRSALIAEIKRIGGHWHSGWETAGVLSLAERAPAVDAVEVVRCKECKHRRNDEDYVRGHYCAKRPSNGGYFCEDNDFCSYGERKDGAE